MKFFLFSIAVILGFSLCFTPAFAQEQLPHEKKIYRSPDGTLYVNKALPIYVRIACSPDENAKSHLLQSKATKQYTNPMYLDAEGFNSLRSPSAVDTVTKKIVLPKIDVMFEMYADSKAPKTKISYGEKANSNPEKTFYGKNIQVALSAEDALSGVEKTYISIDGAAFKEYTNTLLFDKEKKYTLAYYSVDNVGNAEKTNKIELTLDFTPPETNYEVSGDQKGNIYSKRSKIALVSKDTLSGVSTIYYSIDGGKTLVYTGKISLRALSEGEHKITYYAVDNVKNEETAKSMNFFIDDTPPIVVEEVLGDQFYINGKSYSSGRTKLKITAIDNKAGVKAIYYRINNGEKILYDKPFYFPNKEGKVSIKTYAVDNVNNQTASSSVESGKVQASYVDLTGPILDYAYIGRSFAMHDTVYINSKTKIKLKAYDAEAGVKKISYTLDKDSSKTYESPFTVAQGGFHEISFYGYDNVNNSNLSRMFFVNDDIGPEITFTFSVCPYGKKEAEGKTLDVYPSHAVIFPAAKDKMVGYDKMFYSVNGSPEKPLTGFISGFKKNTNYTIKIRALDKLGNENQINIDFLIE